MKTDIKKLIEDYNKLLRDKTILKELDNHWIEVTTPFIDRNNDYIQIYICAKDNGEILLTDDGYTIRDLHISGCDINTPKREDLLKLTLNGFGVSKIDDDLIIRTTPDKFPISKHCLIQAILAVNDMFYLNQPFVANLFIEDVTNWLDKNEVRYTPRVKFSGLSGFDHLFDFVIPKSNGHSERVLHTISKPTRSKAENLVFSWLDTKETRPQNAKIFAMLNDEEEQSLNQVVEALHSYDITPISWSKRDSYLSYLIA